MPETPGLLMFSTALITLMIRLAIITVRIMLASRMLVIMAMAISVRAGMATIASTQMGSRASPVKTSVYDSVARTQNVNRSAMFVMDDATG